jgi:uncharacterized membrane protein
MALAVLSWIMAIPLLGFVTGLRMMTPMAVLCWFAWLGYLPVDGTWAFWAAKLPTALIFSALAALEFFVDKRSKRLNRMAPWFLAARLVIAGLLGAIVAAALNGAGFEGVFLTVACALAGASCSHLFRREIVQWTGGKSWYIAVVEDVFAVGCAILAMGIITG